MACREWGEGPAVVLLHGGYGALAGEAQATLIWRDLAPSRAALGVE